MICDDITAAMTRMSRDYGHYSDAIIGMAPLPASLIFKKPILFTGQQARRGFALLMLRVAIFRLVENAIRYHTPLLTYAWRGGLAFMLCAFFAARRASFSAMAKCSYAE